MDILLYGSREENHGCKELILSDPGLQFRQIRLDAVHDYDPFLQSLQTSQYELIFVIHDGAKGMEGTIAATSLQPGASVIWLSDDDGFGPQSYRLGSLFFGVKPVTRQLIERALRTHRMYRNNLRKLTVRDDRP